MKSLISMLIGAALFLMAAPAHAQDIYGGPRFTLLLPPTTFEQSGSNNLVTTNISVDVHGHAGIGAILLSVTNTAGTTPKITARLEGSADTTNWATVTGLSLGSATNSSITNYALAQGTNSSGTTVYYLIPGTLSTVTADTAGFSGTILVPEPFTNSATLCNNSSGGAFLSGVSMGHIPHYVRLVTTVTGSNSVFVGTAVLIARKQGL